MYQKVILLPSVSTRRRQDGSSQPVGCGQSCCLAPRHSPWAAGPWPFHSCVENLWLPTTVLLHSWRIQVLVKDPVGQALSYVGVLDASEGERECLTLLDDGREREGSPSHVCDSFQAERCLDALWPKWQISTPRGVTEKKSSLQFSFSLMCSYLALFPLHHSISQLIKFIIKKFLHIMSSFDFTPWGTGIQNRYYYFLKN